MYFLAHNWIEFFRNGGFVGSLLVLFRVAGKTTTSSMPQVRRAAVARASPFRSSLYVHPTVLRCRDKRSRKDGTVGSLSLSPPFSLFPSTSSPSILGLYDSRGESMRVCMHSLRSGMTGERIQFPSSLSCLHLQLGPRSDHPRWLLVLLSRCRRNETKPSLPSLRLRARLATFLPDELSRARVLSRQRSIRIGFNDYSESACLIIPSESD